MTTYTVSTRTGSSPSQELLKELTPCLNIQMYVKTAAFGNPETPNEPGIQGALILQSWLKLPSPHNTPVIDSLVSIPMEMLLLYTSHSVASRVVDAALDSPSVRPRDRRRLLMHFLGSYHRLADDRLGSRVADHCWAAADVYLKVRVSPSMCFTGGQDLTSLLSHFPGQNRRISRRAPVQSVCFAVRSLLRQESQLAHAPATARRLESAHGQPRQFTRGLQSQRNREQEEGEAG